MPAREKEGGGGIVAKCRPVMGRIRRRSARKVTGTSRPSDTKTSCGWKVRKDTISGIERVSMGVNNVPEGRVRKAVCRESGLHGLERGKGRKSLPIATSKITKAWQMP